MFEKNLGIGYLLDFYGDVLTERKREVLDYYYNEDLSLAEIAEELGISRQGVRDIIKKSEEELLFLEEKLHLAGRFQEAQKHLEKLTSLVSDFEGKEKEEFRRELDLLSEGLGSI